MKVILQDTHDLVIQARIAKAALAAGRPAEPINGVYSRLYESVHPRTGRQMYCAVVVYNKASITVWPQEVPE